VAITLGLVAHRTARVWHKARPLMHGDPVPPLVAKQLGGSTKRFSFTNRISVVELWSLRHTEYVAELRRREALQRAYGPDGLQILSINVGDDEQVIDKLLGGRRYAMRLLVDPRGEIKRQFHATLLPATFLIDGRGELRGTHVGDLAGERLHAEIRALLDPWLASQGKKPTVSHARR
jgi:hypothetical protein